MTINGWLKTRKSGCAGILVIPGIAVLLATFAAPAKAVDVSSAWTPCTLLAKPELEAAFAASLRDGAPRGTIENPFACLFRGGEDARVVVVIRTVPNTAWSSAQIQRMQPATHGGGFHTVDGIGRPSFLLDLGAAGAALCVFDHDYYLQISAFGLGTAAQVAPAIESLARSAVKRLRMPPKIECRRDLRSGPMQNTSYE